MTARIGEKGQLPVPKSYRHALGLEPGSPVSVLRVGSGLILIPQQVHLRRLCESPAARLRGAGISSADLQSTLSQARQRVFERQYPKLGRGPGATRGRRAVSASASFSIPTYFLRAS